MAPQGNSQNLRTAIIVATVTGVFIVIGACVAAAAGVLDTLIDNGFIVMGPGIVVNPGVSTPTSQASSLAPIATPTFEGEIIGPPNPILSFSNADLDNLIGAGNWSCMDGFPNGISIKNVPANLTVQPPLTRVDKRGGSFYPGEVVPRGDYATGWLQGNLPGSNCIEARPTVDPTSMDQLLGAGNWYCLGDSPSGVIVRSVPSGFVVGSPVILVDKDDVRYYKGETVPSGGLATVWLSTEFPASECPQ